MSFHFHRGTPGVHCSAWWTGSTTWPASLRSDPDVPKKVFQTFTPESVISQTGLKKSWADRNRLLENDDDDFLWPNHFVIVKMFVRQRRVFVVKYKLFFNMYLKRNQGCFLFLCLVIPIEIRFKKCFTLTHPLKII